MFSLRCPECGLLMHRVKAPSAKTVEVGLNQLAYHAFTEHTLGKLEKMLEYTGGLVSSGQADVAKLSRLTAPRCPNPDCDTTVVEDSYLYVRQPGRTRLCCSQKCLDAVQK